MLTGTYCPACGGLRAVNDLTRGDVAGAASSNLVFVASLPLLAAWWLRSMLDGWRGVVRPVSARRVVTAGACCSAWSRWCSGCSATSRSPPGWRPDLGGLGARADRAVCVEPLWVQPALTVPTTSSLTTSGRARPTVARCLPASGTGGRPRPARAACRAVPTTFGRREMAASRRRESRGPSAGDGHPSCSPSCVVTAAGRSGTVRRSGPLRPGSGRCCSWCCRRRRPARSARPGRCSARSRRRR